MTILSPTLFLIAVCTAALGCNSGRRNHATNSAASIASTGSTASTALSTQSIEQQRQPEPAVDPLCAKLRDGVAFFECNNPPRTRDYPDCRTFTFSAETLECPPRSLVIDITGYPGLADRTQASVTIATSPHILRLRFIEMEAPSRLPLKPGIDVAALDLAPSARAKLIVATGLRSYTSKKTLLEQEPDSPPSLASARRPGAPIPIGNGQVVTGFD